MNNSRRGFLASFVTWLTALPLVRAITHHPKSFDFHVRIEEIGEERYRATINCGDKQAIIESPVFDPSHPVETWAHCGRMGMLFEVQRSMKLLAFPQDKEMWNNPVQHWFLDSDKPTFPITNLVWNDPISVFVPETHEELMSRVRTYPPNPKS
jgi:hypothetical protein